MSKLIGKNMLFRTRAGNKALDDGDDELSYVEETILILVGSGAGRNYIIHEGRYFEERADYTRLTLGTQPDPLKPYLIEKIVNNLIRKGYLIDR